MAKKVNDAGPDAALAQTALSNAMHLCVGEPADRADVLVRSVGTIALTPGDGNGDFTIGAGTPDGRAVTVSAQSSVPITANGDIDHVALIDASIDWLVTTTPLRTVTDGDQADVSSFFQRIAAPT